MLYCVVRLVVKNIACRRFNCSGSVLYLIWQQNLSFVLCFRYTVVKLYTVYTINFRGALQVYLYLLTPVIRPLNKLDNYIYFTAHCHAYQVSAYQNSMLSVLVILFRKGWIMLLLTASQYKTKRRDSRHFSNDGRGLGTCTEMDLFIMKGTIAIQSRSLSARYLISHLSFHD